jgi:hypothetical protein
LTLNVYPKFDELDYSCEAIEKSSEATAAEIRLARHPMRFEPDLRSAYFLEIQQATDRNGPSVIMRLR